MILSRELSNNPMGVGFSQGNECMLVDRFANGIDWVGIIGVNFGMSSRPWISRIHIQEEIVNILESLPICMCGSWN